MRSVKRCPSSLPVSKPTFEIIVYQRSRYLGQSAIHGNAHSTPDAVIFTMDLDSSGTTGSRPNSESSVIEIDKGAFQRLAVMFRFAVGIAGSCIGSPILTTPARRIRKNRPVP